MKKLIIVLCFALSALSLSAQKFDLGGGAGVAYYFGDLNTNFNLKHPGPAATFFGRINFNSRLGMRLSVSYANMEFKDSYSPNPFQQARNLSFNSQVIDGTLQLEFNFMEFVPFKRENMFSPYLAGGFSVYNFNPKTKFEGENVALRDLGTEGQLKGSEYYLTQPALAFGGGFKLAMSGTWSLNLDFSTRYLFSDYFDDVSGLYTDLDALELSRGELARSLADRSLEIPGTEIPISYQNRQRGNDIDHDTYSMVTLSIVYNFRSVHCANW